MSDDYVLTFVCDLSEYGEFVKNPSGYSSIFYDEASDIEYSVQISIELYFTGPDGNVSCYMPSCVHVLDSNSGIIDLSDVIESTYYNGRMTGPYYISCKVSLYVSSSEENGTSASDFSSSSNAVIYESDKVKSPFVFGLFVPKSAFSTFVPSVGAV